MSAGPYRVERNELHGPHGMISQRLSLTIWTVADLLNAAYTAGLTKRGDDDLPRVMLHAVLAWFDKADVACEREHDGPNYLNRGGWKDAAELAKQIRALIVLQPEAKAPRHHTPEPARRVSLQSTADTINGELLTALETMVAVYREGCADEHEPTMVRAALAAIVKARA